MSFNSSARKSKSNGNTKDCLHFLYKPNSEYDEHDIGCFKPCIINNSIFREWEDLFYNKLRVVSKLIDFIEPFCFSTLCETAFSELFPNITQFLYEAGDFKHNNKKVERKFKRIADKLWDNGIHPAEF